MKRFFELLQRYDWILLTTMLCLVALGLVAIYGIGISLEPADFFIFQKQFVAVVIGTILAVGLVLFDYRYLRSYGFLLYLAGALMLALVLLVGHTVNETQGWFRFGALSFQPVELAKIFLVAYLAALYTRPGKGRLSWRLWLVGTAATLGYVLLVLRQPDFGSAMVLLGVWLLVSLFARLPRWALPALAGSFLVIGSLVWTLGLQPFQQQRVLSFLHPESDIRGAGYNAAQAQIAIGSGEIFGRGLGEGSQARLRFLPAAATDFIFAVLGEGLGLAGVLVILCLYAVILLRYMRLASEAEDDFAGLLLIGLASIFFIHAIVNMGMNLGLMPITGIPLPFLSAAASSLVMACVSVGIAQSVAVRRRADG